MIIASKISLGGGSPSPVSRRSASRPRPRPSTPASLDTNWSDCDHGSNRPDALRASASSSARTSPIPLTAFGGAGLIAAGEPGGIRAGRGALFCLAAALSQSIYFVLIKPLLARYGTLPVACFVFWSEAVCLLPFAPALAAEVRRAPLVGVTLLGRRFGPRVAGLTAGVRRSALSPARLRMTGRVVEAAEAEREALRRALSAA